MKRTYIFAGGDFDGFFDDINEDDLVIAADRGYIHILDYGIEPDIIMGDFDSADKPAPELENVIVLNPVKDETDTKAAMMLAEEKGYKEIVIYGGLGGRDSHTIANIRAALEYKKKGINVIIKSKDKEIFIVDSNFNYDFTYDEDFYVSIFSLSELSRGVRVKGLFYELEDYDMAIGDSLGVSNETKGDNFSISLEDGYLLVIFESKDI